MIEVHKVLFLCFKCFGVTERVKDQNEMKNVVKLTFTRSAKIRLFLQEWFNPP
jgi:hypothetical protein